MNYTANYDKPARLLKALAHPTRLCIVAGLMSNTCNVSKMKDCLQLPQSTVSQQLAILRAQGIVSGVRSGTEVYYQLSNDKVRELVKVLLGDDLPVFEQAAAKLQ